MVFVWSQMTKGDPNYTLVQVSLNDLIMVVAFAPIVAFLLGVTDIAVPWETLILSIVLYVVIPLVAGALTRAALIRQGGEAAVAAFTARIKPASVMGLLLTVVLLFGFQGPVILAQPVPDRPACGADHHSVLRHLRAGLRLGLFVETAAQDRRPLRADRHVELL